MGAIDSLAAEFSGQMEQGFGTAAVHVGSEIDQSSGAVIAPITLSTTYAQSRANHPIGRHKYTRTSNPNRENIEKAIASLEKAKHALAFSSGTAATAVLLQTLGHGSHVISLADVYGGTYRYFTMVAAAHGVEVTFAKDIERDLESLVVPGKTKMVWIETPSNPTLSLVDIEKVASMTRKHRLELVVDNTFLSPYIQNPLQHGADIVVHSVTKYISGHSDVMMGVAVFNRDDIKQQLGFLQFAIGAVPSPFDCWLAHRGLKTLHLRVREATRNATAIAQALSECPYVLDVRYPGSDSHPQRAVALKQQRDGLGGGMLSFRIKGGQEAADKFCQYTKYFALAESLGGVESLCEVPSIMSHAGIPKVEREAVGVFDDMVRLSCGVEEADDLHKDVMQAIERAVGHSSDT
ncbi:hypothetical protein LCI18_002659 [Fusarium solani-melongenae]|uniref:Uncharacterized protein n=1 Tax=Fusarium solani subsp. cucurbitae TaxID=2747967 RepID=A0ACD3YRZ2_FUSSC|nr:hypothetical protein LCI18_002659 [Fusarium solani-melongenae]